MYSSDLPPHPSGWYFVARSADLPPGSLSSRKLAGRELVIFRTTGGRASALDAHCPHLGAHLGVGGRVEGEVLRCPFHGFCFDADGTCVKTGYGTKPPPKARVRSWPVIERHGLVFVHHDALGRAPTFEIPETDVEGWTRIRMRTLRFRSHVQEIAENSVDIGHLGWVHGYENVRPLKDLHVDGPYLNARYAMTRPRKTFFQKAGIQTEFEIFQYGLGYARVEVDVVSLGLRTRQFVLARPLDEDQVELNLGMSVRRIEKPATIHPLLSLLPKRWLTEQIADAAIDEYEADVLQDVPIWENKIHVDSPALAEGDGPVGRYRRWARQFDPVPDGGLSVVATTGP